ncbi:DUF2231 domain-containing protein [Ilumatobacter sp.]|uniref:DUF2231 domain-containing protein n=1 Tax=Ilumatobacter sp. TaxID=1967498 RepID=UPI003C565827
MIAGVFDQFLGVPTHPLAVHAPLVLIPIATVVAIVFVVRADWRRRVGWFAPAIVLVFVGMLFVAKESGEAAEDADNVIGDIDLHEDLAESTFTLAIIWFVLTLALAVWDRVGVERVRSLSAGAATRQDRIGLVLSAVTAIAAVVTTIWLLRTGHAGSESRWKI